MSRHTCALLAVVANLASAVNVAAAAPKAVVVGSKKFTESYILAEVMAQVLEARHVTVKRKFGLGGTLVCFQALRNGEIDVYPEYSGTLEQAILKSPVGLSYAELRAVADRRFGLDLLPPFGFNNTYAIALKRRLAEQRHLERIGDLAGTPDLRLAFSHEFLNRQDGWPGLAAAYGLDSTPRGIEHGLAYQAVDDGKVDVTDVYSTDGDVRKYDLVLLEDDRGYFPKYLAAPLVRTDLDEAVASELRRLGGRIDESRMRALNAEVLLEGATFETAAREFLRETGLSEGARETRGRSFWARLLGRTLVHLKLTFAALLAALLVATPLGVLAYRLPRFSRAVIYTAGILQTIPSIALLAFMIPLLGIGATPAIAALFLYALLPILRNTAAALFSIDPVLKKVAAGMGLTAAQRLRHVELPLAAPTILAGVRTAAVINIGTATLAAFIGAGGLGEPIVTGLALNDTRLILEGAVPAAVLAVLAELAFEALERLVVPRHLLSRRLD